eukprot:TRINITY_DN18305_c0_g1_i1.p1 TRINITY_DN18305_c0_g1~~TRINITY_DN18305_c0_g1_i1.p1  ORF type:complete len:605 (+),score=110.74 TRINITY_DN18305_c0_g1_i1:75-1817(+)
MAVVVEPYKLSKQPPVAGIGKAAPGVRLPTGPSPKAPAAAEAAARAKARPETPSAAPMTAAPAAAPPLPLGSASATAAAKARAKPQAKLQAKPKPAVKSAPQVAVESAIPGGPVPVAKMAASGKARAKAPAAKTQVVKNVEADLGLMRLPTETDIVPTPPPTASKSQSLSAQLAYGPLSEAALKGESPPRLLGAQAPDPSDGTGMKDSGSSTARRLSRINLSPCVPMKLQVPNLEARTHFDRSPVNMDSNMTDFSAALLINAGRAPRQPSVDCEELACISPKFGPTMYNSKQPGQMLRIAEATAAVNILYEDQSNPGAAFGGSSGSRSQPVRPPEDNEAFAPSVQPGPASSKVRSEASAARVPTASVQKRHMSRGQSEDISDGVFDEEAVSLSRTVPGRHNRVFGDAVHGAATDDSAGYSNWDGQSWMDNFRLEKKPSDLLAVPLAPAKPAAMYEVILHVYDLLKATSTFSTVTGIPIFHLSIEVHGIEYFFGVDGIVWCYPGCHQMNLHRDAIVVGHTSMTQKETIGVVKALLPDWDGASWRLLGRNCQTFAIEFCERLGIGGECVPAEYVLFGNVLGQ